MPISAPLRRCGTGRFTVPTGLGADPAPAFGRSGARSRPSPEGQLGSPGMAQEDLAARLRRLELIELAKVATMTYGRACDRKDVEELRTNVFTNDIVVRLPSRELSGIDNVAGFYADAFAAEPGTRRHFLANQVAEVYGTDRVHLDSYFFFL